RVKTISAGGCLGLQTFRRPSRTARSAPPATDHATRASSDASTKRPGNLTETGQTLRKDRLDIGIGLRHDTSLSPVWTERLQTVRTRRVKSAVETGLPRSHHQTQ